MFKKLILFFSIIIANISYAEDQFRIIGDAETENYLKSLVTPLVKAAKLNADNVVIRIVADSELNAFVAGGMNIFINTGLIIKFADDPNVLYGVIAHELAHIYAGHLTKTRGKYEDMSKVAMAGTILGVAAVLAGSPAGIVLGAGSAQAAQRNILQYSRANETEADKIAVDLLYKTHNNGSGLIKFFQYVSQRDREFRPDPYSITHPLSNERISSVKNAIKEKLGKFGDNITPQMKFELKRIAVKLEAFLTKPTDVINKYKNNNYGLSIGYFRSGKLQEADSLLQKVINDEPNNPYLWELRGQYYLENGKFAKANDFYQHALKLLPNDNIIKLELATTQFNSAKQSNDRSVMNTTVKLLDQILAKENDNLTAYFLLSRTYGLLGNNQKAILALAEFYFYQGSYFKSKILATKILKLAPVDSKDYIRAQDIIEISKNKEYAKD
ncbi:MAG: M48 family metalloprotease [Rickettsiales bacterium]